MESVECAVIGAGVVGLAVARELAATGREVLVLERHASIGMETSSRNSEVIHAGLHYPQGSLKARTCVQGRDLLYAYCEGNGIHYSRCGKLIVATSMAQLGDLGRIREAGRRNGVDDLVEISRDEARTLEPELVCFGALLSPSTGIVDSHALMLSLLGDAEKAGAIFVFRSPVRAMRVMRVGIEVDTGDDASERICARWVINAAGLGAVELAERIAGFPQGEVPRPYLAKGSYFTLAGRAPFSRLVYPVPEPGGLGVHLTLDLAGQARFGPDVEWVDSVDYAVDTRRADRFYAAIRTYWPALNDGALQAAYSGIRPKISGPGMPAADFRIDGPTRHRVPGVVNLFGIESPGLTAALAIARQVAAIVSPKPRDPKKPEGALVSAPTS
jgi:L-2-hydroxyglutarate oxidase LhgO